MKLKNSLEGVHDPAILKTIFLAGGPGSGKTFVSKSITSGHGYKVVSSDKFFESMLKKEKISTDLEALKKKDRTKFDFAMNLRDKAIKLSQKEEDNFIKGRLGIIYDGTGADLSKIKDTRQKCFDLGYDTYMVFVNTSLEIAIERNNQRERTIPKDIVEEKWAQAQNNLKYYKNLFGENYLLVIDNNVFNKNLLNEFWKDVMKITRNPVKNPIGLEWIKNNT